MFVECKDWRYGCCEDGRTFADGPGMKGCASMYVVSAKISARNTIHTIHYDVIIGAGGEGGEGRGHSYIKSTGC